MPHKGHGELVELALAMTVVDAPSVITLLTIKHAGARHLE